MASSNRFGAIDQFKIIAGILVIAIHTGPLTTYSAYGDFLFTSIFARIAVPFFFMASGFFLFRKLNGTSAQNLAIVHRYASKIGLLYLISIILYLPLNVYAGYFTEFSWYALIKDLIFDGTLYHLWYFPALITGVYITFFLLNKLPFPLLFLVTGLLYFIGLLGDSYFGITILNDHVHELYTQMFQLFDYTRNGLFFAPLFLTLGAWTAKRTRPLPPARESAICFITALTFMFLEGMLLKQVAWPRHDSMYVFLVPTVYYLFQWLLSLQGRGGAYLRQISTWMYILHPMCIVFVRAVAKVTGLSELLISNSLIHFFAVTLLSVLAAAIVARMTLRKSGKTDNKHRAWAEINLAYLRHNLTELKRVLPKDCEIMAVVKANAYGHGAPQVAKFLTRENIKHFAVAEISEAIALRKQGIHAEILILGCTAPERFGDLVRYRLTQTAVSADYAAGLNAYAEKVGKKIKVHIKIDTGMGRLGERYENIDRICSIYRHASLQVMGTYSHLSVSGSRTAEDIAYTKMQIDRFYHVIGQIREAGLSPGVLHIQSSHGILNFPDIRCGLARPGIALYGLLGMENSQPPVNIHLRPVLSLKAKVVQVKTIDAEQPVGYGRNYVPIQTSRIAAVSIGYADGISRALFGEGGYVLVRGQRARIAGNICMDQMMIDVTHIDGVQAGDTVTLIGQDGQEIITAEQIARRCGTIPNEVLSGIGARVERFYLG
ncbi:serine racemase VanT catalytic subunit [Paenibacillus faecalis]|uniref:serine racemase VanT catalytic subunit n=1 Tax=Paenibacillus faecalis TaxID=2079532 RepID=UPI001F24D12A|nr:serine racemase VanT catalytic subunit [Paenibacillus faecalis]